MIKQATLLLLFLTVILIIIYVIGFIIQPAKLKEMITDIAKEDMSCYCITQCLDEEYLRQTFIGVQQLNQAWDLPSINNFDNN